MLENSGRIDPEKIEEYIAADGYQALVQTLAETTPPQIVKEISKSGLRGRGGAGYPTGLKWSTVAKTIGTTKYVICNADEGDPGAFMDRSVLESDPHRVLEGMIIAGYAVGANSWLHLCARGISAGHQALANCHSRGAAARLFGQPTLQHQVQL